MMKWKTEIANCTICNDYNVEILFTKNSFEYVKCKKCRLVFSSPRLTPDEVRKIYSIGFGDKMKKKDNESDSSKYYSLIKTFEKYRKKNRILDIGCFNGTFLKGTKDYDWDIFGTEISSEVISYAEKNTNGGDIRLGELEEIGFPDNYFDVIVMLDVIEHLQDPLKTLNEVNRILRPKGLLYFDTPNFNSCERLLLKEKLHTIFPWHFYYFSDKTITTLLERCDFNIVKIKTRGFGTFSQYDPLKNLIKESKISDSSKQENMFVRALKKSKLIVNIYRKIDNSIFYIFYIFSKVGLNFGAHLIVYSEKK